MNILIIDDNKEFVRSLEESLISDGFDVDTSFDGEDGSFKARTHDYDLVILDVILPKKGGRAVCKDIRESGKTYPILVLSADSKVSTKISLFYEYADDYMTKPFSVQELFARIKALLRRPKGMIGEKLKKGDIIMNSTDYTVTCNKKDIYFSRKEFLLLEYFMKNFGLVLSRNNIFEHVWESGADVLSNTLESHILNLRKKLVKHKSNCMIETVTGRGYKLRLK